MEDIFGNVESLIESTHFLILAKTFLAMLLGIVIGIEREIKRKPVGVKTCVIISITTCILTIVSIQSAKYYANILPNINTDPMRLAAQVISGMGFLGAGVIMRKNDDAISGLTTAAILWASAGIGIAVGAGFFFDAIIATWMIFIAIRLSPMLHNYINRRQEKLEKKTILTIHLNDPSVVSHIMDVLINQHSEVENMTIKDLYNGEVKLKVKCRFTDPEQSQSIYAKLKDIPQVIAVDMMKVR
ncbi:MAG: MgtC/SapB family protein [Pasteurellaceae bacterium]|nr:MgtC/SapB family protein [Pasteurellaceae bacterium]